MTDKQHPITPPPELVEQWQDESPETQIADHIQYLVTRSAQWGADQELEACCEWMDDASLHLDGSYLRAARRPKPPSLKEQALLALSHLVEGADESMDTTEAAEYIRRALESIND